MVGQGVLRECLLDPEVETVLTIGRNATEQQHEKHREIVPNDLSDLSAIEGKLSGYDACFFCLGVSAVGMNEEAYRRITYDLTTSVARTLAKLNRAMTFIYVSGSGTDSTERSRMMWARVKGNTENALLQMPFKAAYMFRPYVLRNISRIMLCVDLCRDLVCPPREQRLSYQTPQHNPRSEGRTARRYRTLKDVGRFAN
jgi:hypothetical protein